MRSFPLYRFLFLALLCISPHIRAAELNRDTVRASVTYKGAAEFYIDAGRANGIEPGSTGNIVQRGQIIGHFVVLFAADHSSSCRATANTETIQAGDSAFLFVAAKPLPASADTERVATVTPPVEKTKRLKPALRNQVSARVVVQSHVFHDRSAGGRDDVEPAIATSGALRNIGGSHFSFLMRARSRQVDEWSTLDRASHKRWDHRVYEMAFVYDHPTSVMRASLGRLRTSEISGMGELDGMLLTFGRKGGFRTGAFYGIQPQLNTSGTHSELSKGGVLAVYEHSGDVTQFGTTLALSGEYHQGSISREFAYLQTHWTVNHTISFYQNSELNVYRGWRKDAEGKTLELTNVLVNAVWSPLQALTTTFGYDARTNYRTYETRLQPDSLFDTQLWQGMRASADLQLPWRMTTGVSGGLRRRAGDPDATRNGSFSFSLSNPLGTQVLLTARANVYENAVSSGQQPSLGISRQLFSKCQLGVQAGRDRYHSQSENRDARSNWLHINSDYDVSRILYVSAYAEYYRGGGQNTDRYLMEFGFRY